MISAKDRFMNILGRNAYLRIFQKSKRTMEDKTTKEPQEVTRVLQGEIVGKDLKKPEKGTPTVNPGICTHPAEHMKRGGNTRPDGKGTTWWTCKACKTRWERKKMSDLEANAPAQGTDLVMFGQHAGRTYQEILEKFPAYAEWVVTTATMEPESTPGLIHLATFIRSRCPELQTAEEVITMDDSDEVYPQDWDEDADLL